MSAGEQEGSRKPGAPAGALGLACAQGTAFVKTLLPSTITAALPCSKVTRREVAFQDVAEGTGAAAGRGVPSTPG